MPAKNRPARIGFLLSQLGGYAADLFADQVRPLGVTPSEAGVIRVIGRTPGITQRELADRLGAGQSRVVALIDKLEGKGIAVRARSTSDRRQQRLDLTDAGHTVLSRLRGAATAQEEAITEGLTAEQKSGLYELLALLSGLRGLDTDEHPGYRSEAGG